MCVKPSLLVTTAKETRRLLDGIMNTNKLECSVCGNKAKFRCACCKLTAYCSQDCGVAHYRASHKKLCKRWRIADEDMRGAKLREERSSQLPPGLAAVVILNGRKCISSMRKAQCDFITVCAEINTPASLHAAMVEAQKMIKSRTDKALTNDLFVFPWLYLLDPHPDNVRLCYTAIRFDLLNTGELGDVLEHHSQGDPRWIFIETFYHIFPNLIVKCLVAAEAGAFLDYVDTLLMSRSSMWRDPVVIANLADFLWPQQHCLARAALAARSGQKGLGTIGHLRAAHSALLAEVAEAGYHPPETQGSTARKQRLLELVLSEQVPPVEFEGQPVSAVPLSAPKGRMAEVYTLARMYHPVLHNPRVPLMAQVRKMMAGFMKQE